MNVIDTLIRERNAALESLDLAYAREHMPGTTDDVRIIAMHKARYESRDCSVAARHASGAWLRERGYSRIGDLPWPPAGVLPQ